MSAISWARTMTMETKEMSGADETRPNGDVVGRPDCVVMPICDSGLQIVYEHGAPKGIRDSGGYLFFFPRVSKYTGQEERYRLEVAQQLALADYLLGSLREA